MRLHQMKLCVYAVLVGFLVSGCEDNKSQKKVEIKKLRQGGNAKRDHLGIPKGQSSLFYKSLHKTTKGAIDSIVADGDEPDKILYDKLKELETVYLANDPGVDGSSALGTNHPKAKKIDTKSKLKEESAAAPPFLVGCGAGTDKPLLVKTKVTEGQRARLYARLLDQKGIVLSTKWIGEPTVIPEDSVVSLKVEKRKSSDGKEDQIYVSEQSAVFIKQVAKVTLSDFEGSCIKPITGKEKYTGRVAKLDSESSHQWQLGVRVLP